MLPNPKFLFNLIKLPALAAALALAAVSPQAHAVWTSISLQPGVQPGGVNGTTVRPSCTNLKFVGDVASEQTPERICLKGAVKAVAPGVNPLLGVKIGSLPNETCTLPTRDKNLRITATANANNWEGSNPLQSAQLTIAADGSIYVSSVAGGSTGLTFLLDGACYDPSDEGWTDIEVGQSATGWAKAKSYQVPRGEFEMVCLDGRIDSNSLQLAQIANEAWQPAVEVMRFAASDYRGGDTVQITSDGSITRQAIGMSTITHLSGVCYFRNPCGANGWDLVNSEQTCDNSDNNAAEKFWARFPGGIDFVFYRGRLHLQQDAETNVGAYTPAAIEYESRSGAAKAWPARTTSTFLPPLGHLAHQLPGPSGSALLSGSSKKLVWRQSKRRTHYYPSMSLSVGNASNQSYVDLTGVQIEACWGRRNYEVSWRPQGHHCGVAGGCGPAIKQVYYVSSMKCGTTPPNHPNHYIFNTTGYN